MSEVEFLHCMKILQSSYGKNFDEETIKVWYTYFKSIQYQVFVQSINKIVVQSKFVPSIAELLETCQKEKKTNRTNILKLMQQENYFKNMDEYAKAIKWIEEDNIPEWFIKDLLTYNKKIQLQGEDRRLLSD